jgi:cytoskeletal protein CcmA (bactofilin family)
MGFFEKVREVTEEKEQKRLVGPVARPERAVVAKPPHANPPAAAVEAREAVPTPPQPERTSVQPVKPRTTFIGESVDFEGKLKARGDLEIDGSLSGRIELANGCVVVGEVANVDAYLVVKDLVVSGTLRGTIHATGCITIRKTGRVEGEIHAPRLQIEEGAVVDGVICMQEI